MTVFAVQMQMVLDPQTKALTPRFKSIENAKKWGDIEYLLSPDAHPANPDLLLGSLHEKLRNFGDEDFLLLIGSPVLIGMATSVAAHYNAGSVRFLQWSSRFRDYVEIPTRLF